ncbi:MAG: GAF domain-containing sensor histidine kinase [Chloroflexota bacterium]
MANSNRETSSQQLGILQQFTAELHQATDVEDVVFRVLDVMVNEFGYQHAVVGLVDLEAQVISNWLDQSHNQVEQGKRVPSSIKLPLSPKSGVIAAAILSHQIQSLNQTSASINPDLNQLLKMQTGLIVPMSWGVQPIGVLLISEATSDDDRLESIKAIGTQTAVSIGMMRTRLRRAQATALKEERARIALDIHDSVSQSLFGLVLTLEGTLKLFDNDPTAARNELEWAINSAKQVRQQIQQTIHNNWTEEMSASVFEADLQKYVVDVLQASNLAIVFDIRGDFESLLPQAQRALYRISQECLTNIAHHAGASNARVCVDIYNQFARLVVRDNGRGFEPTVALTQNYDKEHFGLRGMQDRSRSLGGTCDIFSQPDAGTSIVVEFPI